MQTENFSIWRIRFSKVILNLGSWGLAVVLATFAVWGDMLITQARWPIIPYAVVPLAGFFVAFCSLVPNRPNSCSTGKKTGCEKPFWFRLVRVRVYIRIYHCIA